MGIDDDDDDDDDDDVHLDDNNVYDALIDALSAHSGLILSRKTIFGTHVKQSNCHNLRTHRRTYCTHTHTYLSLIHISEPTRR